MTAQVTEAELVVARPFALEVDEVVRELHADRAGLTATDAEARARILERRQSVLDLVHGRLEQLRALPLSADDREKLTVVSPDTGRVRVADTWSDSLGAPLAIIHKRRDPNVANQITVNEIVGAVDGRVCLLVDDMIDTGGTIVKAAEALKANGAVKVIVAATHAIFSDPAATRLQSPAIDEVVVTDTVPIPDEKRFPSLTILPIAPLLARAIHEVFEDGSVTSMFDGAA
jgi:ribose-phosphate pyrophosphokinase